MSKKDLITSSDLPVKSIDLIEKAKELCSSLTALLDIPDSEGLNLLENIRSEIEKMKNNCIENHKKANPLQREIHGETLLAETPDLVGAKAIFQALEKRFLDIERDVIEIAQLPIRTLETINTPPDSRPVNIQEGSGTFESKQILDRYNKLMILLKNDFGIDINELADAGYITIYTPSLQKIVLVCDEEGNASYIFDLKTPLNIANPIEAMNYVSSLTKEEKNKFIEENPGIGIRIFYRSNWVNTISVLLSDPIPGTAKKDKKISKQSIEVLPTVIKDESNPWYGFAEVTDENGEITHYCPHYPLFQKLQEKIGISLTVSSSIFLKKADIRKASIISSNGKEVIGYCWEDFIKLEEIKKRVSSPKVSEYVTKQNKRYGLYLCNDLEVGEVGKHYGPISSIATSIFDILQSEEKLTKPKLLGQQQIDTFLFDNIDRSKTQYIIPSVITLTNSLEIGYQLEYCLDLVKEHIKKIESISIFELDENQQICTVEEEVYFTADYLNKEYQLPSKKYGKIKHFFGHKGLRLVKLYPQKLIEPLLNSQKCMVDDNGYYISPEGIKYTYKGNLLKKYDIGEKAIIAIINSLNLEQSVIKGICRDEKGVFRLTIKLYPCDRLEKEIQLRISQRQSD